MCVPVPIVVSTKVSWLIFWKTRYPDTDKPIMMGSKIRLKLKKLLKKKNKSNLNKVTLRKTKCLKEIQLKVPFINSIQWNARIWKSCYKENKQELENLNFNETTIWILFYSKS